MIVNKKFNNNVLMSVDEKGQEVVLMGNGLAFSCRPGDLVDESKIEKTFVIEKHDFPEQFVHALTDMSETEIQIINKILEDASVALNTVFSDYLYLALADHIRYALKRYDEQTELTNPLLWDIEQIYPQEFKAALSALNTILEYTGKPLKKDEAAYIALHFVNAQQESLPLSETIKTPKMIKQIIRIIEYHYAMELDKNSVSYQRFLVHMRFFAQRVIANEKLEHNELSVFTHLKEKWSRAYGCVEKIEAFIQRQYQKEIGEDERFYLMVHIQRMTGYEEN